MKLYYLVFDVVPSKGKAWQAVVVYWFPSEQAAQEFGEGIVNNRGLIGLTESYKPVYAGSDTKLRAVVAEDSQGTEYYRLMARMPNGERLENLTRDCSGIPF